MQDMKKEKEPCNDESKKERHIVTWTQEEDDTLREQINIHGTNNWTIIASKFKDKTTRQCRRRYYSYLNSEFKRGGWSAEEDALLCEAQKQFGNRWTEIAKVVPGRTDNAVKNRFSTLCRKREKDAALAKENRIPYSNSRNKMIIPQHDYAMSTSAVPVKKMRRGHIPDDAEKINFGDRSHLQNGTSINLLPREPFAVLDQNSHNINNFPDRYHFPNAMFSSSGQSHIIQAAFPKKDASKIRALMQQAEFLSSLAQKVDTENMDQSVEHAWKVLEEFLNQTTGSDTPRHKIPDLQLNDLKDMVEDLKKSNEGGQPCLRKMKLYDDSPGSSEHSTGSGLLTLSTGDNLEHSLHQDIRTEVKGTQIGDKKEVSGNGVLSTQDMGQAEMLPDSEEQIKYYKIVSVLSRTEFNSPLQATPVFRSWTAGIPSPQFSESERNFLKKTLGVESPSLNPSANQSKPTCKRILRL